MIFNSDCFAFQLFRQDGVHLHADRYHAVDGIVTAFVVTVDRFHVQDEGDDPHHVLRIVLLLPVDQDHFHVVA